MLKEKRIIYIDKDNQKATFKVAFYDVGKKGTSPNPYSTVTDFAKFLGLSTSNPFSFEI